jgi:hypothetical protein
MYSLRVRKSLKKEAFAKMELLSETRDGYGDSSKIADIARRFSRRLSLTTLRRSFVRLAGDSFCGDATSSSSSSSRDASIRVKGEIAVEYSEDGEKWALHGRRRKKKAYTDLGLRELVAEMPVDTIEIVEDTLKRMNLSKEMNRCVPLEDLDGKEDRPDVKGTYLFCHRDFANHEELMSMMWKRGGIELLLMKQCDRGLLVIDEDLRCAHTQDTKLLNIIPLLITWEGKLEDGSIRWHTSSLTLGWESFGRHFDRPPAAEKLRKDPWHVSTPGGDPTGDILSCEREGKGKLLFAKRKCFTKGVKVQ